MSEQILKQSGQLLFMKNQLLPPVVKWLSLCFKLWLLFPWPCFSFSFMCTMWASQLPVHSVCLLESSCLRCGIVCKGSYQFNIEVGQSSKILLQFINDFISFLPSDSWYIFTKSMFIFYWGIVYIKIKRTDHKCSVQLVWHLHMNT